MNVCTKIEGTSIPSSKFINNNTFTSSFSSLQYFSLGPIMYTYCLGYDGHKSYVIVLPKKQKQVDGYHRFCAQVTNHV